MPMHESSYVAVTDRIGLRPLTLADEAEFTARARESRELHHPWLFPPDTPDAFRAYVRRIVESADKESFLVCDRTQDGALAGYVTINNIVHGAFRSGALGYGAFARAAGRGLMTEALRTLVRYAFAPPLNLHRLEINVQPGNTRSIALARRAGFAEEGFSPRMLFVDGAWRDHERWAITAEMIQD
ncbi:GNAT family N-acetyltransferase [Streptomyces sp. CO7]